MKMKRMLLQMFVLAMVSASSISAYGQGTVTFNTPVHGGYVEYRDFYESGVWFRVVTPPPNPEFYGMRQMTAQSSPNGTQYMLWQQNNNVDYVVFSMTDGSAFGLASVGLANSAGSGQSSIAITFNGFYGDGSMVSATFNTPLNNFSTFTTFQFGSEFGAGLTRVEIPSQFWIMDNLVVVPEPGTYALFGIGLLAVVFHSFNRRKS